MEVASTYLQNPWRFPNQFGRLRNLSRLISKADVCRFMWYSRHPGRFSLQLRQLPWAIELRGKTTDLECFLKIFFNLEYQFPFEVYPKLIIDAGANIGLAALYFASRYPDAAIIAIEPEEENFELLRKNCRFVDRIKTLHGALWSSSGEIALTDSVDGQPWAFTVGRADLNQLRIVKAFSIPDVLKMAATDRIDILKMDVEGSEREIFSHDTSWLDFASIIVIELHDRDVPGCSKAFYRSLMDREFHQEVCGENIFVRLSKT
jgi:FkbM family methyltransferase